MELWNDLEKHMRDHGYMWKIAGKLAYPTAAEIELRMKALNKAIAVNEQAENGRIILRREKNKTYVYVMIGEMENADSEE